MFFLTESGSQYVIRDDEFGRKFISGGKMPQEMQVLQILSPAMVGGKFSANLERGAFIETNTVVSAHA